MAACKKRPHAQTLNPQKTGRWCNAQPPAALCFMRKIIVCLCAGSRELDVSCRKSLRDVYGWIHRIILQAFPAGSEPCALGGVL